VKNEINSLLPFRSSILPKNQVTDFIFCNRSRNHGYLSRLPPQAFRFWRQATVLPYVNHIIHLGFCPDHTYPESPYTGLSMLSLYERQPFGSPYAGLSSSSWKQERRKGTIRSDLFYQQGRRELSKPAVRAPTPVSATSVSTSFAPAAATTSTARSVWTAATLPGLQRHAPARRVSSS